METQGEVVSGGFTSARCSQAALLSVNNCCCFILPACVRIVSVRVGCTVEIMGSVDNFAAKSVILNLSDSK